MQEQWHKRTANVNDDEVWGTTACLERSQLFLLDDGVGEAEGDVPGVP